MTAKCPSELQKYGPHSGLGHGEDKAYKPCRPFLYLEELKICETYYEIPMTKACCDSAMDIITSWTRRIYYGFSFQVADLRDKIQSNGSRDSVESTSVHAPPYDNQLRLPWKLSRT